MRNGGMISRRKKAGGEPAAAFLCRSLVCIPSLFYDLRPGFFNFKLAMRFFAWRPLAIAIVHFPCSGGAAQLSKAWRKRNVFEASIQLLALC